MIKIPVDLLIYKLVSPAFTKLGIFLSPKALDILDFFVYDVIKIGLLLFAITFLVSIIKEYLTPEKIRKFLSGKRLGLGNFLAACLGAITPFCTCSAIPLFVGLMEANIPMGITFSFLIASPLINEVAIVLLFGLFGLKFVLVYVSAGLIASVFGGYIIGKLKLENEVEENILNLRQKNGNLPLGQKNYSLKERVKIGLDSAKEILRQIGLYILIGVGIGAFIHGYVPTDFVASITQKAGAFGVPIAVIIGVPLYSHIAGVLPIAQALYGKGMAIGTLMAFIMATVGLSLPQIIILRRVIKPKLLAAFVVTLSLFFVIFGYLFNIIF
jgi:hypothetical protein